MVAELTRIPNGKVLLRTAGKNHFKLIYFKDPGFFRERFEIQVEIDRGNFYHFYSVYLCEVGDLDRAQRIAEKKFHQFAKNFN